MCTYSCPSFVPSFCFLSDCSHLFLLQTASYYSPFSYCRIPTILRVYSFFTLPFFCCFPPAHSTTVLLLSLVLFSLLFVLSLHSSYAGLGRDRQAWFEPLLHMQMAHEMYLFNQSRAMGYNLQQLIANPLKLYGVMDDKYQMNDCQVSCCFFFCCFFFLLFFCFAFVLDGTLTWVVFFFFFYFFIFLLLLIQ